MVLRWGIASSGKISHDFVCAVRTLSAEHEIAAVAARSQQSAQSFATLHNIPVALEGYDALAKCQNVDIVYVGAINTAHYELAKLMMANGKHVLCEKPLTMNAKDSKALVQMARDQKVFFMEAVWSRFFPVYKELRKQLDGGAIGDVTYSYVNFGVPIMNVDRVGMKELGGGTILDLGVYALQFTQFVFRGSKPQQFIGLGSLNKDGVDQFASGIIKYSDEKIANVTVSGLARFANEACIIGTKGILKIPAPFWCPTKLITPEGSKDFDLPNSSDTYNFDNSVGLSYEAEECLRCIKQGLLESPGMPHAESIELAELMEQWMDQVGYVRQ